DARNHLDGVRPPSDSFTESTPVREESLRPLSRRVQRQCQLVTLSPQSPLARPLEMRVDSWAEVERRHLQSPEIAKAQAHERIDDRKRLNRLDWIEIVALALVGEVEARSDNRDAADESGRHESL